MMIFANDFILFN